MKLDNIPIRAAIDGGNFKPFGQVQSGIQRLIDSFLKQVKLSKNQRFIFNYYYFGSKAGHPEGGQAQLILKKLPQRFFASFYLPYQILKDQNDIFLGFSGYLPKVLKFSSVKKIVFIHDLGFIHYPKLYFNPKKLLKDTLFAVHQADKIIVFSDYVKNELVTNFPNLIKNKVTRIHAGTDHLLPYRMRKNYQKYFLYVGVIKPIKNIKKVLYVFGRFLSASKDKNYQLILIGSKEIDYFNSLQNSPQFPKLKNKLIFIENVSDKQLISYYLQATAVLNVSLEEGFCYPVLEALSLGQNVIVNNLPIYKEYGKYFANLYIGKTNKNIIKLMIRTSKTKRKSLKQKIPSEFTWNHFSSALLKELTL